MMGNLTNEDPTKRLKRMLEKQGIEWWHDDEVSKDHVDWMTDDAAFTSLGMDGDMLAVKVISKMTPEQAIAATVGKCTDLSKLLRDVTGLHAFAELFGFSWEDGSDWDWHDVACAMADAVDAATESRSCASCPEMDNPDSYIAHLHRALEVADEGAGTCHMRLAYEEEDADGTIWPDHYECDACGAKVNGIMPFCDTEIPPKYCPNCRARVVSE